MPSISNLFASEAVLVIRPCRVVNMGDRYRIEACEVCDNFAQADFFTVFKVEDGEEQWLADFEKHADAKAYVHSIRGV